MCKIIYIIVENKKEKNRMKKRTRGIVALLIAFMIIQVNGVTVLADNNTEKKLPSNPVHHCTEKNDGSDYTEWSYVYFGSYPQTEVKGEELTDDIINAVYTNGDTVINGVKYRRISIADVNNVDNFGNDRVYRYFKWEPIKWKVLHSSESELFVMSDMGLDCKDFDGPSLRWKESYLRDWMRETFYYAAFSESEQGAVIKQNVITGSYSSEDNIYLLSVEEATNLEYGFCPNADVYSASRRTELSDYSSAMGAIYGHWLRSYGKAMGCVAVVYGGGSVSAMGYPVEEANPMAVAPVMHLDAASNLWTLVDDGDIGNSDNGSNTNNNGTTGESNSDNDNEKAVVNLSLDKSAIYFDAVGKSETLTATVTPETQAITWNSDTPQVATVQNGVVTAIGNGTAVITATAGDKTASATVTVSQKTNKISLLLNGQTVSGKLKAKVKKSYNFKANVEPLNVDAKNRKVMWQTSDKKIATVKNGKVTIKKSGTVTITAKTADGKTAKVKLKASKNTVKVEKIKITGKTAMKAKSKQNLKLTITPATADNSKVTWSSSDKKIATVDKNGKVTAKKKGTVTITAKAKDGSGKKGTIKIKVK